jgi:Tfp pilus assembly protein PilX
MKRTTTHETALWFDNGSGINARLACARLPCRQTGIALVMTLVFLTILIILALASMSTTTLEERMSGNMQDMYHAFEAAESSLKSALIDAPTSDTTNPVTNTYTYGTSTIVQSAVTTTFRQYTPIKSGTNTDIYSKTNGGFQLAISEQSARATGPGNSVVTLSRGMSQVTSNVQ